MSLMRRVMAARLRGPAKAPSRPVAAPARQPAPAVLEVPRVAPAPAQAPPRAVRGSCRALSAATGRQCALLEGHTGPHRHGRTEFWLAAQPGQTHFTRRAELDTAGASCRSTPTVYE